MVKIYVVWLDASRGVRALPRGLTAMKVDASREAIRHQLLSRKNPEFGGTYAETLAAIEALRVVAGYAEHSRVWNDVSEHRPDPPPPPSDSNLHEERGKSE